MTTADNKRLYAVVTLAILFVGYVFSRDTIRAESGLSPGEVKEVVAMAQEWSSPKFFRHIEVRRAIGGGVAVWIKEPKESWSITVFTNNSGRWEKERWFLAEEDKNTVKMNAH